jgi:acetyl esterase
MRARDMEIKVDQDIACSGTDLKADLYYGPSPIASVILLHGGGWFHGDKTKDQDLATLIAEQGYLVCVPNYRLTPAVTFPAARDDVLRMLEWLRKSPHGLTESRSKIAFWGSSAGGNLAVEAALVSGLPAIDWSGPLDLLGFIEETDAEAMKSAAPTLDYAHISSASINQGGRNDGFLRRCIMQLVGDDRSRLREATPIFRATPQSGPVYMAHSANEFVPPQSAMKMQQALTAVGVESIVQVLPGGAHAKGFMDRALDGGFSFLRRVLS